MNDMQLKYWLARFDELIRKIERIDDIKTVYAVLERLVTMQNNRK